MSKNFYLISITETQKSAFSLLQDGCIILHGLRFKVEYFYVKVDLEGQNNSTFCRGKNILPRGSPCDLPLKVEISTFTFKSAHSGTLSRISSMTRPSVQSVSDVCLKRICSVDTSAFSALEVLELTALYKSTYLLTYLLIVQY